MPRIIEITDLSMPELTMYASRSEVALLRCCEPEPGVFVAESSRVIHRALSAGYEPLSLLVENRLLEPESELLARCGDVPVYTAGPEVLAQITGYRLTRGVLCLMRRKKRRKDFVLWENAARLAVLEDVVNPTNLGAIFRSAAALSMDGVLLTPGCCDPLYRRAIRVSMGTVFQIPWAYLPEADAQDYAEKLRDRGFTTVAMALAEDSVGLDDPCLLGHGKLAVILGTEGEGLRPETIRACDYTVKIPMSHGVDSLNVAAASAVAFWQLGRR